jgi:3-deoxy-D-manno-octulosonate 8-phosphate phosphatase (KDO 8-P phosphatase)
MAYNYDKYSALILDWDGVFTDGKKSQDGSSTYSEVDLMGINLLRFGYFLRTKKMLRIAIVTGERNSTAEYVAQREHFDVFLYHCRNKLNAIKLFNDHWGTTPNEWMFVFDDVLDFGLASKVGFRAMVSRPQAEHTLNYARVNSLVDLELPSEGSIRHLAETLLVDANLFHDVLAQRSSWSELYLEYWESRNNKEILIVDNAI